MARDTAPCLARNHALTASECRATRDRASRYMKTLLATTQMKNCTTIGRPSPTAKSDDVDTTLPSPSTPNSPTSSPSQPYQAGRNPCIKTGMLTLAAAPPNASVISPVTQG